MVTIELAEGIEGYVRANDIAKGAEDATSTSRSVTRSRLYIG